MLVVVDLNVVGNAKEMVSDWEIVAKPKLERVDDAICEMSNYIEEFSWILLRELKWLIC